MSSKIWYLPDGIDPTPFRKFIPEANVEDTKYSIAESSQCCNKCKKNTRVYAILLNTDPFVDKIDLEARSEWTQSDEPAIIHYVTYLPSSVINQIQRLTPKYRFDFSKTTQSSYWMNHCEHCDAKQGDFYMHCEPNGVFFPINSDDASKITLQLINEPFSCACDGIVNYSSELIGHMKNRL